MVNIAQQLQDQLPLNQHRRIFRGASPKIMVFLLTAVPHLARIGPGMVIKRRGYLRHDGIPSKQLVMPQLPAPPGSILTFDSVQSSTNVVGFGITRVVRYAAMLHIRKRMYRTTHQQ